MIHTMTNRIPKTRRILPFINKPWMLAFKQTTDFRLRNHQVLIAPLRITHVKNAFRHPFASRCLATPFRPFNNDSAN